MARTVAKHGCILALAAVVGLGVMLPAAPANARQRWCKGKLLNSARDLRAINGASNRTFLHWLLCLSAEGSLRDREAPD